MEELVEDISAAVAASRDEIEAGRLAWETGTADEKASYGEVMRELHERNLNPDTFVAVKEELDKLRTTEPRRTAPNRSAEGPRGLAVDA